MSSGELYLYPQSRLSNNRRVAWSAHLVTLCKLQEVGIFEEYFKMSKVILWSLTPYVDETVRRLFWISAWYELLIRCYIFVRYWRKTGILSSIYWIQENRACGRKGLYSVRVEYGVTLTPVRLTEIQHWQIDWSHHNCTKHKIHQILKEEQPNGTQPRVLL